jgi:hypothetical protein
MILWFNIRCPLILVARNLCTYKSLLSCCSLYDQIFRPSKLSGNADFHLFKAGVEPKWEDPECANGGKWTVPCSRKATFENMWLETVHFSQSYFNCSGARKFFHRSANSYLRSIYWRSACIFEHAVDGSYWRAVWWNRGHLWNRC